MSQNKDVTILSKVRVLHCRTPLPPGGNSKPIGVCQDYKYLNTNNGLR